MFAFLIIFQIIFITKPANIGTGERFSGKYDNSPSKASEVYNFVVGTFVETEIVNISSASTNISLVGAGVGISSESTMFDSSSNTSVFNLLSGCGVTFRNLSFGFSGLKHSNAYFVGNPNKLFFDYCVISNIMPCSTNGNAVFINISVSGECIFNNTDIVNFTLASVNGSGGLIRLVNTNESYFLMENCLIKNIKGANYYDYGLVWLGNASIAKGNFTKCAFSAIVLKARYSAIVTSFWKVLYVGRCTFDGYTNTYNSSGIGCVYVNSSDAELTVVQSSFNNISYFSKGGGVAFYGALHSYTDVNFTNIRNASSSSTSAGIYSKLYDPFLKRPVVFLRCTFRTLQAARATAIFHDCSNIPTEIRGCIFYDIKALNGRPAGIESYESGSGNCDIFDSQFELLVATGLSTVFHVNAAMTWNSITIKHCSSGGNGGVCCQLGALACDNATFVNVSSGNLGAVSHYHSGSISYTRSTFQNCKASNQGGAVYSPAGTSPTTGYFFSNCVFLNNSARSTNGGNDIYFTGFRNNTVSNPTLSTTKFYGCCSTSLQPRINNLKEANDYLPQCSFSIRYVNVTGGAQNITGCGTLLTPCKNLAYCGSLYATQNPLEIVMSGETFTESESIAVASRVVRINGTAGGKTKIKCESNNTVIINITTASLPAFLCEKIDSYTSNEMAP